MSGFLLLLFLFQSGLAFAFTLFLVRLICRGTPDEELNKTARGLRWFRNGVAIFSLIIPLLVFLAFWASLPPDAEMMTAVWPAVWIAMILAAITMALAVGSHNPSRS